MPPARSSFPQRQRRRNPYPPFFPANATNLRSVQYNRGYGGVSQQFPMMPPPFMMAPAYVFPTVAGWTSGAVPWLSHMFDPFAISNPAMPFFPAPIPTRSTRTSAVPDSQVSRHTAVSTIQDGRASHDQEQVHLQENQTGEDAGIDVTAQQPRARHLTTAWNDMFQRLLKYKNKHGNCLVPAHYKKDPKLGRWVTNQRHRRDPLSEERKQLLDSIGFVWRVKERSKWEDMYERLVEYRAKHGDCRVPQKYKDDPRLGEWVQTQRRERTRCNSRVFAERREKLDAIGFEWCPHQIVWEHMFERLVAYKEKHGNCLVPRHHHEDPKLGRWVDQQRVRNRKGGLPPERKEQLDSAGFVWSRAS